MKERTESLMKFIYCSDPIEQRLPDADFEAEAAEAIAVGAECFLVSYEALVNEADPIRSVRRVPKQDVQSLAVYRGWMLKPAQYEQLYEALLTKGLRLMNTPKAYRHCHYLPESYDIVEHHTPRTVWIKMTGEPPMDRIMDMLEVFGGRSIILKDWVKSRKHEWDEACFIASASDRHGVERVVRRFLELQDDDLNEGLVFREFIEFEPIGVHPKSGMPLTREFRMFFLDGTAIDSAQYWAEGKYIDEGPPDGQFLGAAQEIQSRFFTMDVAKRLNGEWMIVEVGDGQVSGLPPDADVRNLYQALAQATGLG